MRPSARLLLLGLAATALSILAVAYDEGLRQAALAVWFALLGLVVLDLVLSWRGRAAVATEMPPEIFAGEAADLTIRGPDYATSEVEFRLDWPEGVSGPEIIRSNGREAAAPVRALRRGVWPIGRLWMRWRSRLRLLEFTPKLALDHSVAVAPNIRPVQSGQIDVMVKTALFGAKEARAKGEGSEFHQLREFVAGMDRGAIDWKHSARQRKLLAKEMRAETNHHVILAIDNGHLMREEIAGLPKVDHAINAALATAWAAVLGGDLIGMFAFDSRPRVFMPPAQGRAAFARMRSRTAELAYSGVETNHTLAMAELNARTPRRSLIVVFSDFVDTTTAELLVENLGVLRRRHAIVFVALRDPALEDIAHGAPRSMDDAARAVSAGQMLKERRDVMGRLERLGVTVLDARPGELTPRLVSTYLDLKAREVI